MCRWVDSEKGAWPDSAVMIEWRTVFAAWRASTKTTLDWTPLPTSCTHLSSLFPLYDSLAKIESKKIQRQQKNVATIYIFCVAAASLPEENCVDERQDESIVTASWKTFWVFTVWHMSNSFMAKFQEEESTHKGTKNKSKRYSQLTSLYSCMKA